MMPSTSGQLWATGRKVFQAATRKETKLVLMLAAMSLAQNAPAKDKAGDWQVVQNLRLGTHVIVKSQHSYSCAVEGVTDSELICEVHYPRSLQTFTLTIPRPEIREVRTLPNQRKDALIGAGIGGAAGAVAAGLAGSPYPGFHALVGGAAGAGGGALVGSVVPIFQLLAHHGKIIYKN